MTNTTEDLLFFKLKDLITEQSEGEWTDAMIVKDAHHFANNLRPMLAASPQGEGSSAVACPHEAWPVDSAGQQTHCVDCGCTHPAPIKPSADTEELRERVARIVDPSAFLFSRDELDAKVRHHPHDAAYAIADAILSLIQSERAG